MVHHGFRSCIPCSNPSTLLLKKGFSAWSTKNKTKLRPSLQLDGTLSSILTIKPAAGDIACHKFEPPSVLDSAKKQGHNYTSQKEEAKGNVCDAPASTDGSRRM